MTEQLLKLFAGSGADYTDPHVRSRIGKAAGITGLICNALLFLGKLAAGLLAGSVSIIADAMNNLTDAASSLVTLLGFRLAQRPADEDHPYGHARYEYLAGLVIGALILVIGLELGISSVRKIFAPTPLAPHGIVPVILAVSMVVKLWMGRFFQTLAATIRSTALRAAAADSRSDCIATGAVLLGFLTHLVWGVHIDGVIGLAVAAFILYSGCRATGETISLLLGTRSDPDLERKLTELIRSHEAVLGIHDLLIHDYGPGQCFASVHAELSADHDTMDCHDIADDIERDAWEKLNVHMVIHIDPVPADGGHWNRLRQLTEQAVADIDPRLSIHDFRIVTHEGLERIAFDLAVPYDLDAPDEVLKAGLSGKLESCGIPYPCVIQIDRKP